MGYLHIGQNVMVPEKQIIGIFDLDNTSQSKWTRKFLADAEQEGVVLSVTEDVPRSSCANTGRAASFATAPGMCSSSRGRICAPAA